jgi:CHASE2 domain-containing sensor protein
MDDSTLTTLAAIACSIGAVAAGATAFVSLQLASAVGLVAMLVGVGLMFVLVARRAERRAVPDESERQAAEG